MKDSKFIGSLWLCVGVFGEEGVEGDYFVVESFDFGDFAGDFDGPVAPDELDDGHLRLEDGQLLPQTGPRPRAEAREGEGVHALALALPSLGPELHGLLVVLLAEVGAAVLEGHQCPLLYGQVPDVIVLGGDALQEPSRGPVVPGDLALEAVHVDKPLQVLVGDVRVAPDDCVDFRAHFSVDFGVAAEVTAIRENSFVSLVSIDRWISKF